MTLLGNDMDKFLPRYFALLEAYAVRHLGLVDFVPPMLKATEVMARNTDPSAHKQRCFLDGGQQLD